MQCNVTIFAATGGIKTQCLFVVIKLKCPEMIQYSPNRITIVEFSSRRISCFLVNRDVLGIRGQTERVRCVKCQSRNELIQAK